MTEKQQKLLERVKSEGTVIVSGNGIPVVVESLRRRGLIAYELDYTLSTVQAGAYVKRYTITLPPELPLF
ncbi:hypothetical protein [Mycolicibacterium vanbaalenii]|uniref:hypothetical protein n=1 Tax=Mycolicibacterium vanbaalenii TaxID=110539 RepID=UPI0002FFA6C5|nr:hypothetical protein [Mycolicibacterium vanbaalenii]MCV7130796.1 hypothetical protein [Mycolicibacterium vanbaalenii PYR-1]